MLFLPISLLRDGRSAQPKRSSRPCRRKTRQRPGLLLLRRLPLGLRSHRRPGPPHPRRCPRRCKTQNRPHRCLPGPTLCRPSTSPSTNIARPSAPMPGANPSATPSTATTTTSSRPTPNPTSPNPPTSARNLDDHALHFDHTCRLLIDGKPFRINTYAPPATVDSKPLTPTLSPLSAILTKNQGG